MASPFPLDGVSLLESAPTGSPIAAPVAANIAVLIPTVMAPTFSACEFMSSHPEGIRSVRPSIVTGSSLVSRSGPETAKAPQGAPSREMRTNGSNHHGA